MCQPSTSYFSSSGGHKSASSIMLVDRDDISLFIGERLLELCGYTGQVLSFSSPESASEYLDSNPAPDFIIADYFQNSWDNFSLLDKIAAQSEEKETRIIVMVDYISDVREMEQRYSNCKFIRKPLSVEMINRVLG